MSVTEMIREMSGKPRWTIAEDYHPQIVSVSHYVHRHDPRFIAFDAVRRSVGIPLPYRPSSDR